MEPESVLVVERLRCEYRVNPRGIGTVEPRLSWGLGSKWRDQKQRAYQIMVADSKEKLEAGKGNLWNTGKIESSDNIHVKYKGRRLKSGMRCYWKVRVWDKYDRSSGWSKPAMWSMGLLDEDDWKGEWIGLKERSDYDECLEQSQWIWYPEHYCRGKNNMAAYRLSYGVRYFRRLVILPAGLEVVKARLVMMGDYNFVCFINGEQAGEKVDVEQHLSPKYSGRVSAKEPAKTYPDGQVLDVEVTSMVQEGRNILAVAAKTDGYPNRRSGIIGALHLELASGGLLTVVTNGSWRTSKVKESGWMKVDFEDSDWQMAEYLGDYCIAPWGYRRTEQERSVMSLLQKEFAVEKEVREATVYVCGLGCYELMLNGRRAGERVLEPGWTNYRKSCLYSTYNVTGLIRKGGNAVGVMLGNSMYSPPGGRFVKFKGTFGPQRLIFQLDMEFSDGTKKQVVSDGSWRAGESPITYSCIFGGEDYDARKEQEGWDEAGFDDSNWKAAEVMSGPGGQLVSQSIPSVKVMEVLRPVSVSEPEKGVYVYDLGRNFSGRPQLKVRGKAGAKVKLIPGELLNEQGLVYQRSSGKPHYYTYTLKGEGTEVWHPRFTYYGFRYVQVEGASVEEDKVSGDTAFLVDLEGHFVRLSARRVGGFSCSNELLNRIHEIITSAMESNMQSVLTDCPHREKTGWLEQVHLMGPSLMYNYELSSLYAKIFRDISEAQLGSGFVPNVAPEYVVMLCGFRDSPEWGSASVIAPWYAYKTYGDTKVLKDNYEVMKRYVRYLSGRSEGHIVSYGLGDWYDIGPNEPGESQLTPLGLTATGMYYYDVQILKEVAGLLGKDEESAEYAALAGKIGDAFNKKFFDKAKKQYGTGSQTANAMPLIFGLAEQVIRKGLVEKIVKDIREHDNHTTSGDVGHFCVINALTEAGRSDVLYDMACRTDSPSYGYQIKQGATTLTEAWDAARHSSQNHFMLGHIEQWFYEGLAGIKQDANSTGFEKIVIKPQPVGDLKWVKASYDSIRGEIAVHWRIEDGTFILDVKVPVNTTATVYLPAKNPGEVAEGGAELSQTDDVKLVSGEGEVAVLSAGSGEYSFSSRLP